MRARSRLQSVLLVLLIALTVVLVVSCAARIAGAAFPSKGGPRLGWMIWFGSFEVLWKSDGLLRDQLRLMVFSPQLPLIYYFKPLVITGTLGPGTIIIAVPLIYPVAIAYLAFIAARFRDWRRMKQFLAKGCACDACGYPLSDGMERCPECGKDRASTASEKLRRPPRGRIIQMVA